MNSNVHELVRKLEAAKRDYYDNGESNLTDDEYDALRDELSRLGVDLSNLTAPPEGTPWTVRRHLSFMSGMSRQARNGAEWDSLDVSDRGELSLKYDGLSLELQYSEIGHLVAAVLRGDGAEGEDVLVNALRIPSIPRSIRPVGSRVAVFGEIVISWNNLKVLNEYREIDGLKPYKSPRSAVAMIRSRSVSPHHLSLMAFRPFDVWSDGETPRSQWAKLKWLTTDLSSSFKPVDTILMDRNEVWNHLEKVAERRYKFQYQMDGLVYREPSGECVKIKFPAESAVTTVTNVVEQLGRTGIVAPVVEFEPIELTGATVTRATAHNAVLAGSRLPGLGKGAKILVSRRGDVIPHVESVITPASVPWTPVQECPSCGSTIVWDGSTRRCSADPSECPGTSIGLVVKYCRELGIDDIGPATVAALMRVGMLSVPADLYLLNEEAVAAVQRPGGGVIGPVMASRICNAAWKRHTVSWGELLGAIGIPGCAKSVMEAVAAAFPDPDKLRLASVGGLETVESVGPERAAAIASFIATRWDDVIAPLLNVVSITRSGEGPLAGMTICITLGLKSGSRAEMEAAIRRLGGTVKSSVSKKVTHLVCNYPDEATTKIKQAKKLGIPIISEDELVEMMGASIDEDSDPDPTDDF